MRTILTNVFSALFGVLITFEKWIYRRSGVKLHALRWYWHEQAERLQNRLNRAHGTNITYGYIHE